jgi:hypothetical protein
MEFQKNKKRRKKNDRKMVGKKIAATFFTLGFRPFLFWCKQITIEASTVAHSSIT